MFDFFVNNKEITLLLIFFLIASGVFVFVKNQYVKAKTLGWMYIIWVFLWAFILPYGAYILAGLVSFLALYEMRNMLIYWKSKNFLIVAVFTFLLGGLSYAIISSLATFFMIFILIAISDIVAYSVWKTIVWKRWFTSISPNKTLSWCLAQGIFVMLGLFFIFHFSIFISLMAWVFAPLWDLIESYFKRKAQIKDSADYIPWHGWVLDRIDSSIFVINFILIITFVTTWSFQI